MTFFNILRIVCIGFFQIFIIIKFIIFISMCFLKTLKPLDTIPIEKGYLPVQSTSSENYFDLNSKPSFSKILQSSPFTFSLTKQDSLLLNLLNLVNSNTKLLNDVDQKLTHNDQIMNNCFEEINFLVDQSSSLKCDSQLTSSFRDQHSHDPEATNLDPLVQNLFGKKNYLYKLQLQSPVPEIIYKQRNINLSVILKNKQNQKVLNSNILHLCLGVCDAEGEWITENKAKQNFMKGKTEIEMYHGEGCFLKIYPKEVSRNYAGSKLNFVVYSKPSMLKFTNSSSTLEKIIDSDLIQPLVIKDISVRAKKNSDR